MDQIRTIIVGMDFSPAALSAARQALRIAAWHRSKVKAVHVADLLLGVTLADALAPCESSVAESVLEEARRQWEDVSATIHAEEAEFLAMIGGPTGELTRVVREHQADLLILGMRGTSSSGRGAGTHASQLVRHAPADVLLVCEGQYGPFRTIVACVDFSDTSKRALLDAARLAEREGAALHVVYVYRTPWTYTPPKKGTPERDYFHEQYAAAVLRGLSEYCDQAGPEVARVGARYSLVEDRTHARGIARFAELVHADLIVLGRRGRTNVRDLLIGSTAERVVREAGCSVLTVPPVEVAQTPMGVGAVRAREEAAS